ncbi:MAG: proteasome assembly chaperone family protein, partial [Halobacteriaceae archaeon]
ERVEDVDLEEPAFIEGLPGVGQVGKLAVEHLIEEFDTTLVRRVHSEHLPPQVLVDDDGVANLVNAAVYAVETEGRDLLLLTGDQQAADGPGHYRLTNAFLDIAEEFDVADIYALGGVPTGELVEEHDVIGAVSTEEFKESLESVGVEFRPEEPAGGIVGTSGLLVGLGKRRNIPAACLMGETSGYLVDPKSARAVLEALTKQLDFEVGYESLEERADEMEEVMETLQDMEEGAGSVPTDDDLRYIG